MLLRYWTIDEGLEPGTQRLNEVACRLLQDPGRRMIAGLLLPSNFDIYLGAAQPRCQRGTHEQMVHSQAKTPVVT